MTDDTTDDSIIQSAVGELDTAKDQSTSESYRASLQGWRRIAGSTVGFAVFVDLVFLMAGWTLYSKTTGWSEIAGIAVIAIGLLGLVEKTYRRAV